jgi:protein N-terminal amidase
MFDKTPITDYLEDPQTGITFQLCSSLAKWLNCYIIAGYPERLDTTKENAEAHQEGANSAHVVKPDGTLLMNYRKTNLFPIDKSWAKPGTGFAVIDLPEPLNIRVALGICMDINVQPPATWTSLEDGPYELASFAREKQADLLILLNAWLSSDQEDSEVDRPDEQVFRYWYARLRPLWCEEEDCADPLTKEVTVAICNRCGQEEGW